MHWDYTATAKDWVFHHFNLKYVDAFGGTYSVEIFEQGGLWSGKHEQPVTDVWRRTSRKYRWHRHFTDMQQPPEPKAGWTAMTFSLINIDLAKTVQKLLTLAASSSPSSPREEIRAQIMKDCKIRMENWLSYCNLVIPQQRLALSCSRFAFRKLDFTTRLHGICYETLILKPALRRKQTW